MPAGRAKTLGAFQRFGGGNAGQRAHLQSEGGFRLILCAHRHTDALKDYASRLSEAYGVPAHVLTADFTDLAAVQNCARFGRKTPCQVDGKCHDCRSPEKICRALTVLWAPMGGMETEVVLIDEALGM